MNFEEFKDATLRKAKECGACSCQYERAKKSKTIEELIEVIKYNLVYIQNNQIVTGEMVKNYERPELFNVGRENYGLFNSGDHNSGYRNSGVFCTRKREDTALFFNKESSMTWNEWYSHPAYGASSKLSMTAWISWNDMNEKEKVDNPKADVCGGYLKAFNYHEAWKNLWEKLTDEQRGSFKTLPNFDSSIFKEITGIDL